MTVAQKVRTSVVVVRGATLKKRRKSPVVSFLAPRKTSRGSTAEWRGADLHRRGEQSRGGEGILVSAFGV
uniref:Uncharacterized protein n=1 Tax=Oryza meridionalis TaxID=40149 RepID=A0A0E0F8B4_9ORYZ